MQGCSECEVWVERVQPIGRGPGQRWVGVSKLVLMSRAQLAVLREGGLGWGLDPIGDFGIRGGMRSQVGAQ